MKLPNEILVDVLSYFTRNELEYISISNRNLYNLVRKHFRITPFRVFSSFFMYLSSDCCLRCKFQVKNNDNFSKITGNIDEIFHLLKDVSLRFMVAIFVVEMRYFNYKPDSIETQSFAKFNQLLHIWSNSVLIKLFFDSYNRNYFKKEFEFYPKFAFKHLVAHQRPCYNQNFEIFIDGWEECFPLNVNLSYMKPMRHRIFGINISSSSFSNKYLNQLADFAESEYNPANFTIGFDGNPLVEVLKNVYF